MEKVKSKQYNQIFIESYAKEFSCTKESCKARKDLYVAHYTMCNSDFKIFHRCRSDIKAF